MDSFLQYFEEIKLLKIESTQGEGERLPPKDDTYTKYIIKNENMKLSLTVWVNKNKFMGQGKKEALQLFAKAYIINYPTSEFLERKQVSVPEQILNVTSCEPLAVMNLSVRLKILKINSA